MLRSTYIASLVWARHFISPVNSSWVSPYFYTDTGRGADKSLARSGRKQATVTEDFDCHIPFIIIIGGILVLYIYIYITRLASNEIYTPSHKIRREVGRARTYHHLCILSRVQYSQSSHNVYNTAHFTRHWHKCRYVLEGTAPVEFC
jgi:hypothetical protein